MELLRPSLIGIDWKGYTTVHISVHCKEVDTLFFLRQHALCTLRSSPSQPVIYWPPQTLYKLDQHWFEPQCWKIRLSLYRLCRGHSTFQLVSALCKPWNLRKLKNLNSLVNLVPACQAKSELAPATEIIIY